jgi:hypothetical protein
VCLGTRLRVDWESISAFPAPDMARHPVAAVSFDPATNDPCLNFFPPNNASSTVFVGLRQNADGKYEVSEEGVGDVRQISAVLGPLLGTLVSLKTGTLGRYARISSGQPMDARTYTGIQVDF